MTSDFLPGRYVSRQIAQLVGKDPANLRPSARGMLAQLRHAASAPPGTVAAVWPITAEGIPEDVGRTDRERLEAAIHLALTQWATHQQSRATAMHVAGQPFGRAVRLLAERGAGGGEVHETPVYRRFTSLSTSSSRAGIEAHARGLIGQLRSAEIGFDYGDYADDLYWLLTPGRAPSVHRAWGRDFHSARRRQADDATPSTDTDTDTTITHNEGDQS